MADRKNLLYSDNAIASSSEDDLSPSTSGGSHAVNITDCLMIPNQDRDRGGATVGDINLRMPDFNKRPLSDTPAVSTSTSPSVSNTNSEDPSVENSPEIQPLAVASSVTQLKLPKRRGTAIDLPGVTKSLSHGHKQQYLANEAGSKLVIVMVGLPARGKSYITNKLTRYLNWLQHECRVFNVGNTRRKDATAANIGPSKEPLTDVQSPAPTTPAATTEHDASFFNPENKETTKIRDKWAMDTLDQLLDFVLEGKGSVGIFDATNSTKVRRQRVLKKIRERSSLIKVLFLESICSDPAIVQKNVHLKLSGPDYKDMDPQLALKDFTERLHNYEKAYETIEDDENLQYIKMIDVGKKVVAYNIQGFLASQAIYYLLNFNLNERQIWITRHGESVDNVSGRIGGDAELTQRGEKFALTLSRFIQQEKKAFRDSQVARYTDMIEKGEMSSMPNEPEFNVWTSMLTRAVQTADYFPEDQFDIKEIRMLNELCAGTCEGMTYEEIQNKYPDEYSARIKDKLRYRYPGIGGESYLDVINRVRPIINEVERTTDHVLLITHRVVARVLLGYFMNLNRDVITNLDIPLHCVYLLEPKPYGVEWSLYEYDEQKDWFFKISEDQIHKKKVKEVEVAFRERKYSVVPTAPPRLSHSHSGSSTSTLNTIRAGLVSHAETLKKARGIPERVEQAFQQPKLNLEAYKLNEKLSKLKATEK
jgi:6-phosphofructo-2-kinase